MQLKRSQQTQIMENTTWDQLPGKYIETVGKLHDCIFSWKFVTGAFFD